MTTRKRSADTELTSCSVSVLEPVQLTISNNNMYTTPDVLSKVWTFFKSLVEPLRFYTNMTYGTEDGDNYIQSSSVSIDDTATLKRQKTRTRNTKASRARSVEHGTRKSGRGKVDLSGCQSDAQAREVLDAYWRPRGHSLLRNNSTLFLRPDLRPEKFSNEQSSSESTPRRHSDSSVSPLDSSSSPFIREPFILHPTKVTRPHFTETQQASPLAKYESEPIEPATKSGLEKQIEKLLLADEGEREKDNQLLTPSSTKEKQRFELYKRREHERAEKLKREREEKEQAAREARRASLLNRRLPQKRLIQPLNTKWDDIVTNAQSSQNENKTLTTSIGGTELAPKDFRTLLGLRAWLNDEIINAYIEWVVDAANKNAAAEAKARGEASSKVPKFIAHNSFFYENLTKKGPASTDRLMKRKGAPGKSLMEVDSLFVPICRGSHWTVGVVRPVVKTIEYFDSYGGPGQMFIAEVRKWLNHQLGKEYLPEEWTEPRTACATQSNGWDCGVFVCTNAFCVGFGIETSCYLERDMAQQRRNIAAVLMNRGFVGDFSWESWGL